MIDLGYKPLRSSSTSTDGKRTKRAGGLQVAILEPECGTLSIKIAFVLSTIALTSGSFDFEANGKKRVYFMSD